MSNAHRRAVAFLGAAALLLPCSCSDSDDDAPSGGGGGGPPPTRQASRPFRAVAGISMGAFGALHLATARDDLFGAVAALGGPVDLERMLHHLVHDNLEVKEMPLGPRGVGADFTFDHMPPYPSRQDRISMAKDLFLAFGNPFLHHPDPDGAYLAHYSEPALLLVDDRFGAFSRTTGARSWLEGGDLNDDGLRQLTEVPDVPVDVLLLAAGTLSRLTAHAGTLVGDRQLADIDNDGVFDVGDGIVVNMHEPFDDVDRSGTHDPGEPFDDFGLDGVAGNGDFGEGNGAFDVDPDLARWRAADPAARLRAWPPARVQNLAVYLDVGLDDAFELVEQYQLVLDVLRAQVPHVEVRNGFDGDCLDLPGFSGAQHVLVRYQGGHIGIPSSDDIRDALQNGDVCGSVLVWQRLLGMLGFLDANLPDGDYGLAGAQPFGDVTIVTVESPILTLPGEPTVEREVLVYRPPAWFNSSRSFPIVYFMHGYGQDVRDYERIGVLLDTLIATDELQNLYFVVVPGGGGVEGSFYVDFAVPPTQAPEGDRSTGRYMSSLLQEIVPRIEDDFLGRRIRSR